MRSCLLKADAVVVFVPERVAMNGLSERGKWNGMNPAASGSEGVSGGIKVHANESAGEIGRQSGGG